MFTSPLSLLGVELGNQRPAHILHDAPNVVAVNVFRCQ